ncbi:MAG TPA: hypothetical protein VMR75_04210 [Candidatus Saccharimonadales bacterium]|nr:hypothetical protein [Candidatus Saccharimonadales bacterium]
MRARRAGLAALLAVFGYLLGTAAAPLLFSSYFESTGTAAVAGPVIGVAYAAPDTTSSSSSAQCSTQPSNPGGTQSNPSGSTNCPDQTTPSNGTTDSSNPQGGVTVGADGSTGINQDSCEASSSTFGWLTCPMFDSIAHFISGAAKDLMQQFLNVQPLQISNGGTHYPLYDTWSAIRLLADTLFVLIFLVLIFAHVLQFNIDAYAIKKMIPKLVAGVILVQFSYVLSSGLIDIGNILGNGIGGLIGSVTSNGLGSASIGQTIIENLTTGIAAGALVSLALVSTALALPVFLAIAIAAIGFITTLAVRYFLLGLLIVVSPLAFAAWVLPNTEVYFNKWLSTFVKLVLMYPIIMALLSVAGDVGGLIPVATNPGGAAGIGVTAGTSIIKLLVVAACFAAVPATFKWAGGAMSAAYGAIGEVTRSGMRGHWNTVNSRVARERAQRARLDKADEIHKGLARGEGRYGALNKIPGKGFREFLVGPGTKLFAASSGDLSTRQAIRSSLVSNHAKDIESLHEAQDSHNLEHALMHYYLGQQASLETDPGKRQALLTQQSTYMSRLRAVNAESLSELTGNELWREGMMQVLGKNDSLKPPLSAAIQKTREMATASSTAHRQATHELLAFTRQGFSNYGAEPLALGLTPNPEQRDAAFVLKDTVGAKLRDLDASKIKSNSFSDRNFQVLSSLGTGRELPQAKRAAELFAENVGAGYLRQNFAYKDRNEMSGEKKLHFLLGMARNEEAFGAGAKGEEIRAAVVDQITKDMATDRDTHTTLLNTFREAAIKDAKDRGLSETAAEQEANDLFDRLDASGRLRDYL